MHLYKFLLRTYVFLHLTKKLRLYVSARIFENNSGHIQHQHSAVDQPARQLRNTQSGLGNREGHNVSSSTYHKNTQIFHFYKYDLKGH